MLSFVIYLYPWRSTVKFSSLLNSRLANNSDKHGNGLEIFHYVWHCTWSRRNTLGVVRITAQTYPGDCCPIGVLLVAYKIYIRRSSIEMCVTFESWFRNLFTKSRPKLAPGFPYRLATVFHVTSFSIRSLWNLPAPMYHVKHLWMMQFCPCR